MEAKKKPKTMTYWINTAIVLFCFFGFGLLPDFGLGYAGMRAVGIFLGLLWGWITVEFGWVSILGIIAMGTTGAMDRDGYCNFILYSISVHNLLPDGISDDFAGLFRSVRVLRMDCI